MYCWEIYYPMTNVWGSPLFLNWKMEGCLFFSPQFPRCCASILLSLDTTIVIRYYYSVIRSFTCKETEKLFHGKFSAKLSQEVQRVAQRKLKQLNGAATLDFLRVPPGNRLEQLSGNRAGQWSIRINDQWRICFRWEDGSAFDVEIIDYH